jgi:NAD(P)-dependent dehydrogenase (short-subunit alcohol dehydrogenase family)
VTEDLFSVDGRVVVVTGGLGLLGREFCRALVARGARVAVFDLPAAPERVAELFGDLPLGDQPLGERLRVLPVDITRRETIAAGLAEVEAAWGPPHGLVNSAAIDSPPNAPPEENGPFESYPEASWEKVMRANVTGTFLCCQVVGGALARAGRGSIVNISSHYGLISPDQRLYEYRRAEGADYYKPIAYSTSKSALLNLTRYLATYWAPRGVRVNTLTFGGVFNNHPDEFVRGYAARTPLGRMARQGEYTGGVIFLLSDASSYMTGANLVMDGGWTAW